MNSKTFRLQASQMAHVPSLWRAFKILPVLEEPPGPGRSSGLALRGFRGLGVRVQGLGVEGFRS